MVLITAILPLVGLAAAHCHAERRSSPEIDRQNADALRRLRERHPYVEAHVIGGENAFERRQQTTRASGGGGGQINSAAIAAIRSTTTQIVEPALATPTPGTPGPFSGAPSLPSAAINPANYPALDRAPPTDTQFVQQALAKVDLSKVPNIPVNNPGGCAANNTQAVANAAQNGWWSCGGYTRATDVTVCPNTNTFGFSADDGPSPDTPRLLQALDNSNPAIKATFFVVGSRAISRPAMLQYEYLDGHQICVHTWSHTALTTQTNEQIVAELAWTAYAIKQITGVTPNCMRPPYGDIDDRVRYISLAMGMTPIIWTSANGRSFDTQDWQIGAGIVTAPQVVQNFEAILQLAPTLSTGFIVLSHDLYQQSVDIAVDFVLPYAASQPNLKLEPIITCLGKNMADAYIETASNTTSPASATGTRPGSTATGVLSALPSNVPGTGGSNNAVSPSAKGAAQAAVALPPVVALVAGPAIALAVLVARLA